MVYFAPVGCDITFAVNIAVETPCIEVEIMVDFHGYHIHTSSGKRTRQRSRHNALAIMRLSAACNEYVVSDTHKFSAVSECLHPKVQN